MVSFPAFSRWRPCITFSLRAPEAMLCAGIPSMSKQKTSAKFTDYTRIVHADQMKLWWALFI